MKKRMSILLLVILVLSIFSVGFTNAEDIGIRDNKINIESASRVITEETYKQLDEFNEKLGIDIESSNVEREVITNKLNDKETIKKSLNEPVVVYEENITYTITGEENQDDFNTASSTGTEENVNRTTYAYGTTTLTIQTGIRTETINTSDPNTTPMKIKRAWSNWSTNNQAGDGSGGGVNKVDGRVKQMGQPYGSGPFTPLDTTWTQQQNEFATGGSFTKFYNPSTYSLIPTWPLTGGAAYYFATYDLRFESPTPPYLPPDITHISFERVVGFGSLPN